jgi:hypothetical protein
LEEEGRVSKSEAINAKEAEVVINDKKERA